MRIVILTGGYTEAVRLRYERLGVQDIYMRCAVKLNSYEDFKKQYGLNDEEILYMGDDIPDVTALLYAGVGVVPSDAVEEAKNAADIIAPVPGGRGFVRWTLEQVMKEQGRWFFDVEKYEKLF